MAQRAKPTGKKPGSGKSVKDQVNSLDEEKVREYFDQLHGIQDDADESDATFRGRTNRVYDTACTKLDVTKEALKMVYHKERAERKIEAAAAKMDARGRDCLARFGAALGDSPLGNWATSLAKVKAVAVEKETKVAKEKPAKKPKATGYVVPLKKTADLAEA